MKALVLRKAEDLEICSIPVPEVRRGMVLVRVRACGICGSDLRYFYGHNPWAKQTLGVEKPNPPNMVLGHEVTGEIVEVGEEVDRARIGERVVLLAFKSCGVCRYCRRGQENLCADTVHLGHGAGWGEMDCYPGGMAEFCPVWSEMAYPLPEGISYEEGTFLDGLGVAVRAVTRSALKPMEDVVILGVGPIGAMILQVARSFGARRIFCTEIASRAMRTAEELGADAVVPANEMDVVEPVMERTEGLGVDVVFNTVGSPESQRDGLRMLARGGRLVVLVSKSEEMAFDARWLSGERTITTSANSLYADFQTAIDLMTANGVRESGRVHVEPLITHRFPLEQSLEAFEAALNKDRSGAIKVIIRP